MQNDPRPDQYRYWDQLMKHLDGDGSVFFNGDFVYPRQFEIHLPGNHEVPCNLNCPHCAGRHFDHSLGHWEMDGLELLDKLKGAIPFHIYGGAYTEPLMNPYYLVFLAMTKKHGNHFGIHTNGTLLGWLEGYQGWLTELNRLSTDDVDYLSVSIDAGTPESWCKVKGVKDGQGFWDILDGLSEAVKVRKASAGGHAIRLCYLASPASTTREDFESIVRFAKESGVDSLRFSIPFANYNQDFVKVRSYKEKVETPGNDMCRDLLGGLLSESQDERPYIFYTGPEFTDVDKFDFRHCLYGYYQVTFGADGYVYKCSTTATPTAHHCRLGKVTSDVDEFRSMVLANYNKDWDAQKCCFENGLRCNRMGLEINREYADV